MPADAHLVRI